MLENLRKIIKIEFQSGRCIALTIANGLSYKELMSHLDETLYWEDKSKNYT